MGFTRAARWVCKRLAACVMTDAAVGRGGATCEPNLEAVAGWTKSSIEDGWYRQTGMTGAASL